MVATVDCPQPLQKMDPCGFANPQWVQAEVGAMLFPQKAQNPAPPEFSRPQPVQVVSDIDILRFFLYY